MPRSCGRRSAGSRRSRHAVRCGSRRDCHSRRCRSSGGTDCPGLRFGDRSQVHVGSISLETSHEIIEWTIGADVAARILHGRRVGVLWRERRRERRLRGHADRRAGSSAQREYGDRERHGEFRFRNQDSHGHRHDDRRRRHGCAHSQRCGRNQRADRLSIDANTCWKRHLEHDDRAADRRANRCAAVRRLLLQCA